VAKSAPRLFQNLKDGKHNMKDVILFKNIRPDVATLSDTLSSMIYKDQEYGQELLDFNQYDESFNEFISVALGEQLKITEQSGLFRKPFENIIHFEGFNNETRYIFALAYEDIKISFWKHKELNVYNVFGVDNLQEFIHNNCADVNKWEEVGMMKLSCGDAVCFRPWLWHSFSENKLVQIFYIEEKTNV